MVLRYQEGMKKQLRNYLERLALEIEEKVRSVSFSWSLSLFMSSGFVGVDFNHQL